MRRTALAHAAIAADWIATISILVGGVTSGAGVTVGFVLVPVGLLWYLAVGIVARRALRDPGAAP